MYYRTLAPQQRRLFSYVRRTTTIPGKSEGGPLRPTFGGSGVQRDEPRHQEGHVRVVAVHRGKAVFTLRERVVENQNDVQRVCGIVQ